MGRRDKKTVAQLDLTFNLQENIMDTIQRIACAFTGLDRTYRHTQPLDYSTGIEYAKERGLDVEDFDIKGLDVVMKHIYGVLSLPIDKDNEYSFLCFVVCVAVGLEREDLVEKTHIELSEFCLFLHEHVGARKFRIKIDNQIHTVDQYTDFVYVVGPLRTFNPYIFNNALGILRRLIIDGEISNSTDKTTLILEILGAAGGIISNSAEAMLGLNFDDIPFDDMDCSLHKDYLDIDELQSTVSSLLSIYRQVA
jgi:hypothetical protein